MTGWKNPPFSIGNTLNTFMVDFPAIAMLVTSGGGGKTFFGSKLQLWKATSGQGFSAMPPVANAPDLSLSFFLES